MRRLEYAAQGGQGNDIESITKTLKDWESGEDGALERLIPAVILELRRIAAQQLRGEREGHTLQPTALVNELYLRLAGQRRVSWQSRAQFFGFAAQCMRRILVDHARTRGAIKRGGAAVSFPLEDAAGVPQAPFDLSALDQALERLGRLAPRQARLVELRFFAGLSSIEAAEALGVGVRTAEREWASAKAWLFREMEPGSS